jgi:hypothetical protein
MKSTIFLTLINFCVLSATVAQNVYQPNIEGANPISPTAFQFTKYTELPVTDYTGIPDISVPLYTIKEDDINLPLALTYHAVGIRVNQEASWVGLGWDLAFGSIVQSINDVDDFYNLENGITLPSGSAINKVQPDYSNDPSPPNQYPYAYQYDDMNLPSSPNPLVTGYFPVISPQQAYGYKVATDYWIPENGTYVQNTNFFTQHQGTRGFFDSEPDIFTANFLGQSLTFMLDWTHPLNYNVVVLNKRGYTVTRVSATSWEIQSPQGDQFYFETESTLAGSSSGTGLFGLTYSGVSQPVSNVWLLTRIITKKGKTITISYSSAGNVNLFPNYSEVWQYPTLVGTEQWASAGEGGSGNYSYLQGYTQAVSNGGWGVSGGVEPMWGFNTETKYYPSSITFENGKINFYTSATTDQVGGMRLDSLHVVSSNNTLINSFKFAYSYFPVLSSPGNGWNYYSAPAATASQRLQLLNVSQLDSGVYTFTYDPHPLPQKNSYAADYWGFYNGQTANTSLSPNPAQFNMSGLPNNGNNHSAFLSYARAGILTGVQYPTGGSISLLYELNQFNNYWVPDSNSSTNTVSHGNGIRIHSVTFLNNGSSSMEQFYTYDVGKSIYPIDMFKNYDVTCLALNSYNGATYPVTENDYSIWEASSQGFYSSNPLIGNTGVGYDTVTKTVDSLGTVLGKTVTTFVNNPALGHNIFAVEALSATLPAIKQVAPENGSVNSVQYYNNNNVLLKQEQNTYTVISSPIYYGARLFGYTNIVSEFVVGGGYQQNLEPQNLLGFYPIYDVETLPSGRTTTEYDVNGNTLVTGEGWGFDQYDQLWTHTTYTPAYYTQDWTEHTGSATLYTDAASVQLLANAHRYADVLMSQRVQGPLPYQNEPVSSYYKHYETVSGVPVESYVTINKNLIAPTSLTDTVTYDNYDPVFINAQQVTSKKMRSCILWDYEGIYPIAEVKNATIGNVAYTSFEANGSGNWTITSANRDNTKGLTGNSSYALNNGSVSVSGLSSATTYIVSYWSTGSSYSVSGTTSVVTGKTVTLNGYSWTYYEHNVTGVTSVTVSGNGNIDELRLYPGTAQMTTYTYSPLLGMTSQCDVNNHITYFLYDLLSRLSVVQDQDGNNIKRYCYSYNNQTAPCILPPAPPAPWKLTVVNNNSVTGYTISLTSVSTPGLTYTLTVGATGTNLLGPILPGEYNVMITTPPGDNNGLMAIFSVGSGDDVDDSGSYATFSNLNLGPTSYNTLNIY